MLPECLRVLTMCGLSQQNKSGHAGSSPRGDSLRASLRKAGDKKWPMREEGLEMWPELDQCRGLPGNTVSFLLLEVANSYTAGIPDHTAVLLAPSAISTHPRSPPRGPSLAAVTDTPRFLSCLCPVQLGSLRQAVPSLLTVTHTQLRMRWADAWRSLVHPHSSLPGKPGSISISPHPCIPGAHQCRLHSHAWSEGKPGGDP